MVRPDRKVFESAARIGFNEKPFVDFIDAALTEATTGLINQVDEVQLRILQGRAQVLNELKKLIRESPELLRKA